MESAGMCLRLCVAHMLNTLRHPQKTTSSRESKITRNALQEIDVTNKKRRCWELPGNGPTVESPWRRVKTTVICPVRHVYRSSGFDSSFECNEINANLSGLLVYKNESSRKKGTRMRTEFILLRTDPSSELLCTQ